MRQLFTVTSTVTQWTQSMTDSNAMHYSLASRHNFASFRTCDFYWDKRSENNKRVYKEFFLFVNVVNVYHIQDECNAQNWYENPFVICLSESWSYVLSVWLFELLFYCFYNKLFINCHYFSWCRPIVQINHYNYLVVQYCRNSRSVCDRLENSWILGVLINPVKTICHIHH